ncbi:MAG TPA: HAMP domain-containing sensor histidine kinase, partial [Sphingomonas sp.]
MRFDDSLKTVLNADMREGFGAQAAWRQLVDLAGRGRTPLDEPVIARLRMLRQAVPVEVRAASARGLAYARPDARLVAFFAEDALAVAAPVVRTAELSAEEWIKLLPRLTPALRSVLRHRRDLPEAATRGLESFGPIDFSLPRPEGDEARPVSDDPVFDLSQAERLEPDTAIGIAEPAVAADARVLAEAPVTVESPAREGTSSPTADGFAISDLVARIEAFRRQRDQTLEAAPAVAETPEPAAVRFLFETDAKGTIIGVDGVARGALIGLSITHAGMQGLAQLDGVASGAFRQRSRFDDARLEVGGASTAAGSWRLAGVPFFEPATGRFSGFRGVARRPRPDQDAAPSRAPSPDALRQLVHELRTPTNAIAGFAELIETELLGPVADPYRDRARSIRRRAADLLAAIEDLDTAARMETGALELRPEPVEIQPLMRRVVDDLGPLATMRGVRVIVDSDDGARATADDRALERLLGRLFATLVAAGGAGESIRASVYANPSSVEIAVDRPRSLAGLSPDALLNLDAVDEAAEGMPLLGTGFALRVARNLASELGGALD